MSMFGNVRIGSKAPDFRCEAVCKGIIDEVSLSTYINENKKSWLIILFIPAAFSFVCPTEVLAFQNCLEEFKDRNCDVVFVSVDTKHSLWHWQNVPRQYGGLGQIDIALLSDANHRMSRDYGVLIESQGVCLRGMFILDEEAVVQQITLNNLTVGRSVLEALRLLEAFQAVAKHGVLCPIDWKPSSNAADTLSTISNTLTESYEDRLLNMQKDFGDTVVTDLDAKHKREEEERERIVNEDGTKRSSQSSTTSSTNTNSISLSSSRAPSLRKASSERSNTKPNVQSNSTKEVRTRTTKEDNDFVVKGTGTPPNGFTNDFPPHKKSESKSAHFPLMKSGESASAPPSANITPAPTPSRQEPPSLKRPHSQDTTARHARGHCSAHAPPKARDASTIPAPPTPSHLLAHQNSNLYESRRGSHVILEFADPTSSPQASPHATPGSIFPPYLHPSPRSSAQFLAASAHSPPPLSTPKSAVGSPAGGAERTRLQATFEAIKKMSAGLTTPRGDLTPKKNGAVSKGDREDVQSPGYFDVIADAVEV